MEPEPRAEKTFLAVAHQQVIELFAGAVPDVQQPLVH